MPSKLRFSGFASLKIPLVIQLQVKKEAVAIFLLDSLFNFVSFTLPHYGLCENLSIGSILGRKGVLLVLDAEHNQRLIADVAHRTLGRGCNLHNATLRNGDNLAIDLHLALALEEEVELLVSAVGVQEARLTSYGKTLERELGTRGAKRCAGKYLTRDLINATSA